MNPETIAALLLTFAALAYLLFALLKPEKL